VNARDDRSRRGRARTSAIAVLLGFVPLLPDGLMAQGAGEELRIVRATIDSGGARSSSPPYMLWGTVGQPDAGMLSAPGFTLYGGFRSASTAAPAGRIFADSFEPAR
jgi:hypothetical protein